VSLTNLPPVSTTIAKLVAKFAAVVVDTGVVDTGYWDPPGLGGNSPMKKARSKKIS
jgi:hypothetical protein